MEFFEILSRNWKPGIGDPTVMGWVTVVGYFVAAFLLLYKRKLALSLFPSHWKKHRWLLLGFALLMIALGINKQFDLQTFMTNVGRDTAEAQGWYENRRMVQIALLAVLGIGVLALGFVVMRVRGVLRPHRMSLVGMLFLLGFVAMRASSFFKVDRLLGFEFAGVKMNWVLELGGIGIIIASVLVSLAALRKARHAVRQRQKNHSTAATPSSAEMP